MNIKLIGLISVLVLVVIGIGFFVYQQQNNNAQETQKNNGEENISQQKKTTKLKVESKDKKILPDGYADPTVLPTDSGYRMYVNGKAGNQSGYLAFKSADGINWTKETDIIIAGVSTGRAILDNGQIQIFYPGSQPIKPSDPQANIYKATSSDGINFTKNNKVLVSPQSTDYYLEGPTVFQLEDKSWRMYFNENTVKAEMQRDGIIWGASSEDGESWIRDSEPTISFDSTESAYANGAWSQVLHPFVLKNPNGGYLMFYNSHSKIFTALSKDGISWEKNGYLGIEGADVDGYFVNKDTINIYYGNWSASTGGLVYMGVLKLDE